MIGHSSIFTVDEVGQRAVVRFCDWRSALEALSGPWERDFICHARNELENLNTEHTCTTLAIDMSPVTVVPSSFLGLLVSLHKSGLKIELLRPSQSVRETLDATQLNRIFTVRSSATASVSTRQTPNHT
jgi:anti-anti-sigma regulatory factor